jgi:hypothetical protein
MVLPACACLRFDACTRPAHTGHGIGIHVRISLRVCTGHRRRRVCRLRHDHAAHRGARGCACVCVGVCASQGTPGVLRGTRTLRGSRGSQGTPGCLKAPSRGLRVRLDLEYPVSTVPLIVVLFAGADRRAEVSSAARAARPLARQGALRALEYPAEHPAEHPAEYPTEHRTYRVP